MTNKMKLPLRIGVGIILLNNKNEIFVAKRIDNPKNFSLFSSTKISGTTPILEIDLPEGK